MPTIAFAFEYVDPDEREAKAAKQREIDAAVNKYLQQKAEEQRLRYKPFIVLPLAERKIALKRRQVETKAKQEEVANMNEALMAFEHDKREFETKKHDLLMKLKVQNEEIREKRRLKEARVHSWLTILSDLRFLGKFKAFAEVPTQQRHSLTSVL